MITQGEMLEKVFLPLRAELPATSYQLMLVQYLQSLLHAQIPAQPQLCGFGGAITRSTGHIRSVLIEQGDAKALVTLSYLYRVGLLTPDLATAQRQLIAKEQCGVVTDLALETVRHANDYATLLDYYLKQQQLDEMLLVMGKYADVMKEDLDAWLLNAIKLGVMLYEEQEDLHYLYSVFFFARHYRPVRVMRVCEM